MRDNVGGACCFYSRAQHVLFPAAQPNPNLSQPLSPAHSLYDLQQYAYNKNATSC